MATTGTPDVSGFGVGSMGRVDGHYSRGFGVTVGSMGRVDGHYSRGFGVTVGSMGRGDGHYSRGFGMSVGSMGGVDSHYSRNFGLQLQCLTDGRDDADKLITATWRYGTGEPRLEISYKPVVGLDTNRSICPLSRGGSVIVDQTGGRDHQASV
ncbi:hypothetical protein ElyMa_000301800 [Elysia marginata]|uniref:Autotransporter domain-containing protein n=1 Tax=Elysia marginata TaxID=1093978 RepID=A0AAV4FAU5_9GAST|nr:hypothetical protein ElyMa_000301800 [Elysia marginata]